MRKGSTISFLMRKKAAMGTKVPYKIALGEIVSERWMGNRNVWLPLCSLVATNKSTKTKLK